MHSPSDIIVVGGAAYYRSEAPDGWAGTGIVVSVGTAEWYQTIFHYWM